MTKKPSKPLKIYIAGPILGEYKDRKHEDVPYALHEVTRIMNLNVQKAIQAAIQVMKFGHFPFLPHLNYYLHINSDTEFPRDYWLQSDNTWPDFCDALLYLAPCNGADKEWRGQEERPDYLQSHLRSAEPLHAGNTM